MILDITNGKSNSGNTNISISDKEKAEEYFSRVYLSEKSG
jgi:hypothetical protein